MTATPRPSSDGALRPHLPLKRYYQGEESRHTFVVDLFDTTASDYDFVERMMALGWGSWYRRRALLRAGLVPGMKVLDVACGTGLVTRGAMGIVGGTGRVVGLDPSFGMLTQAWRSLAVPSVRGLAEELPVRDESVDVLSLGYALRHLSDLAVTFGEFRRVLRPGGRVCILEMTPPQSRPARSLMRLYVRGVIPALSRLTRRRPETAFLWEYFWDTMDACVPPATVLEALGQAGFADAGRYVELGIFSEYTGTK